MSPTREDSGPRIWVELDDLIRYFDRHVTPTGIGRVQLEIVPQLLRLYPRRVGIIRIGKDADDVRVLAPQQLQELIDTSRDMERRAQAGRSSRYADVLARYVQRRARALKERWIDAGRQRRHFRRTIARGDVILALGGSWTHRHFGHTLRTLKERHGIKFALLVHDILPVTHPFYVSAGHLPNFVKWLHEMMQTWDIVFTPSKSAATALRHYLEGLGETLPPIRPIPFGFGFGPECVDLIGVEPIESAPFVLFVSTVEVRKNHILLYRLWERLIEEHGSAAVPTLVFAGSPGWGVEKLKGLMHSTGGLGGKIRMVSNLSDRQMARAYQDCLFTLFPSFCEGWGLPVAESLFHNRLCIASNATSIPEVGGSAVDYFEPEDEEQAYACVKRALFEPGYLEARQAWIRDNFRLPLWEDTARTIFDILARSGAGPSCQDTGAGAAASSDGEITSMVG